MEPKGGIYARYFLKPQPEAGKRLRNRLLEEGIPAVTKLEPTVTKSKVGRPKRHETGADRARAYRERKKAHG